MGDTSYKLMHAVRKVREGKLDSVRDLISSPRLHYSEAWSQEGYVLLLEAVKYKQNYIAKLLLACGCKVDKNKSTRYSNTPLHFAVLNNDIEIVHLLLNRGANINAKAEKNIIDCVFDKGAGYTPLHLAVQTGREEMIKVLLNRGANVNAKTQFGITALYIAIEKHHKELVEVLRKYGAKNYFMNTSKLHVAVRNGHTEIIEFFLKFGADINSKDKYGRTALHIAIEKGHTKSVEVLLKCGAKIDFRVNASLLHMAVTEGYTEIVEALLKFGADVDSKDKDDKTALDIALRMGHKRLVELLLKCGAKIGFGFTTLIHEAVRYGWNKKIDHHEIIEILLKFGADINSKDIDDRTALHIAIQEGSKEIVEVLLKCGAKIDFMNTPPLHVAVRYGRTKIIEILLKFGVDIDSKDKDGRTALHIAASECEYGSIVETLLNFGADIDSKDEDGRTGLHYACKRNNRNVIYTLLKYGCDINVTCKYNQTPVELAMTNNNCNFDLVLAYIEWNSVDILKTHIIKMKTANLYVNKKNLLSINSDDEEENKGFQNECEKEIASMKSEKVNNGNVSFYDILTKDIKQLAVYVKNDSIAHVLRSNDYKRKFRLYASIIDSNLRKAERRREFLEQNIIHINKIVYLFYINFGLPQECTEEIFSYLSCTDLRILFSAY